MNKHLISLAAGLSLFVVSAAPVFAAPIVPAFTTFGTLSAATFGGAGIPNTAVAITTFVSGSSTITLGLTATQRLTNPALTNDGAGTFFANAGNDSANGQAGYAIWNWNFYVNVSGPDTFNFQLQHEFAPGATDASLLSVIPFTRGVGTSEDSWNEGMAFLGGAAFNPNIAGQYSFVLRALDLTGNEIGRSAINVNVDAAAVPEPTTLLLLGTGLVGLAWRVRRRSA